MPIPHIHLDVPDAQVRLVDPPANDYAPPNRQIKILAVQPDRARLIREPIFLIADAPRHVAHDRHVLVVHIDIVARLHDPFHRRQMVGPRRHR